MRVVVRQQSSFHDNILGQCEYGGFRIESALYGGYSYKCERGFGSADYVDPKEVVELARKAGHMVHLAGSTWVDVGKKGWGEQVTPDEALALLQQLRQVRGL